MAKKMDGYQRENSHSTNLTTMVSHSIILTPMVPQSINLNAMVRSSFTLQNISAHDHVGTFGRVEGVQDRAHSDKTFIVRNSYGARDNRVQFGFSIGVHANCRFII